MDVEGKVSTYLIDKEETTNHVEVGLLQKVLTNLKKIEYHLSIASDTNLQDQDV